jgi:hypothetical protein
MLLDLMESHAEKTKNEIFEMFRDALAEDQSYQRAVDWYFFLHMYDYATDPRRSGPAPDPVQRAEARVQRREAIQRVAAQIVMLDLTMPNGKTMRECTGAEMAKFGNRFQKIAEKVGKTKTVGAVLSEEQVRGIMK